MLELYQIDTGHLAAAQMKGVETKASEIIQQYLWASYLKTKQTSDLKMFNLFHRQTAERAVNVTRF